MLTKIFITKGKINIELSAIYKDSKLSVFYKEYYRSACQRIKVIVAE